MTRYQPTLFVLSSWLVAAATAAPCPAQTAVPLTGGARAVWDIDKAYRQKTPTRERVCLNGLWRWQPAKETADAVPADRWGYFKVPGSWPGVTDYMQKDSQTVHVHPSWASEKLAGQTAAWYQREITVPGDWAGRRIAICLEYLNSYAAVFVDGKKAGELRFPAGEADLTAFCRPGGKHVLSILVVAMPLKAVMLSYTDTASAREVKGTVARRGLCGDVYLAGVPAGPRIADVRVDTSVRKGELTLDAALEGLATDARYVLRAEVLAGGASAARFTSKPFGAGDLKDGRFAFTHKWMPEKLWDLHTPQNAYHAGLTLVESGGKVLDAAVPVRFGFREFWIDGRDFYLNGTRVYLSSVPLDNAQIGAALASYDGARESLLRLKGIGINFVYTHNYGCEPGSHLGFEEILRAADDVGMLVSLSQPHFSHYQWQAADADRSNGYARHAEFYVRAAGSHPSVVFYSMSHNATGYSEDMNPDMIDGLSDPRDAWSVNNARLALRAEAIVRRLDPGRIVYHHSSGNLGSMHTSNFYPNFAPIQELSDWFEHWAATGVKPVFTCEYGAPFTWDWSMYRGWYKGERSFGSARVPWEFCFAEWNAQFLGDRAFRITDMEKANLRWEARQFREGRLWHRWDYPYEIGSPVFDDRHAVMAMYLADNWRAFRTWGMSANSPWEHGHFWRLRPGMNRNVRQDLKVDWENLQRPGFSPDYLADRYERMDLAYERSDWVATADGRALLANNQPLLAYIGGKAPRFTSKDHNFLPGETVEKQLIIINNSRQEVSCECTWSLALPQPAGGAKTVAVQTGRQERVPLRFDLPPGLAPGKYELAAAVRFAGGETQKDALAIHVLPPAPALKPLGKVALFDPKGETGRWLASAGAPCQAVAADADLAPFDILIVGKAALTVDGPGPAVGRVRDGLKVVVFEQASDVLEKRFGFRVEEYGLRCAFKRVSDHPVLAGLDAETLRDWRGEATILPPRLKYEMRPRYGPTVKWCGIDVTRAWRAGCRGSVASVLIEKPARGDFLPVIDGGFSLQFSPLIEYREGKGLVLFCQMDVTGRTETDPAAERLARNILDHVSSWKPGPVRKALYAGDPAGKGHLEKAGLSVGSYDGGPLSADQVLVVGPGGGKQLAAGAAAVADWLKAGGRLAAVGLDQGDADALPFKVTMKKAEHIATYFEPFAAGSPLAGIGPADVHNRDPRELPLVSGGAAVIGDGVLAVADSAVFCQLAPWQFDYARQFNVKRTYRRTSFLVTRVLAGMGAAGTTPILARFSSPVDTAKGEKRWLDGPYLDQPEEMDDPYRFFRW
jgi:beta-galactosidase/beta-glucuronidase